MKKPLMMIACALISFSSFAQVKVPSAIPGHGGGNGGDELELELKKRSLQISQFLKTEMGKKTFKMLNPDAVVDIVNTMDIDVTDKEVFDRYNTLRTCVNYPERQLIECNLDRITAMKVQKKEDILTATLFHEILGLLEIEIGHQENVSSYPISSKIIPYSDIIISTPVSESDIRPEYYGLDKRSYGVTYVNKKTNESVRLICLSNNVEIHRCRNYSVVKNANGMQIPLHDKVISLSKAQIEMLNLKKANEEDLAKTEEKLQKIKDSGFKFITLRGRTFDDRNKFGTGALQWMHNSEDGEGVLMLFYIPAIVMAPVDTTVEIGKQALNLAMWPIKSIVNGIRLIGQNKKLKKINKRIEKVQNVLNVKSSLSLVGKTEKLKDKDFNTLVNDLNLILETTR